MVKLFCAIIEEEGSTFPVDIDKGQTVGGLKKKIKEENEDDPTLKTVAAKNLQLFLTKTESDRWLSSNDSVVIAMRKGDVPEQVKKLLIKEMDPAEEIGDIFGAAPTKNVVHVLVVVPAVSAVLPNVLLIGVNEGYAALISSYMEIAGRLKENKKVRSLSNYLARVVAKVKDDDEAPPFFVLENSSGTGKTQMAFNLIARGECDVFYIVCGDLGDREQPVYNAYATRTGTFQECVNQDLEVMRRRTLREQVPLGSIGQIRSMQTLSLYGFILAALQGKDRFYGPKERSHVFDELRRRQESRMKPFVFFLDEFPRAGKHLTDNAQQKLKNSLRMMRNVFRSFGLAVVMSSTNGTARNLVVPSSRSRQDGPQLWCRVFPCFPDAIVKDDPNVPELLMEILRHSRPLFAQIALKYMQENPYIHGCDFTNYLNAMVKTPAVD
uniref:Crinkling and necrosis inducing protein 7 n=1 Tax=Phytophthora capsici TaxID=4784 RepID=A0A1L1UKU7_PHYCP|nr:crinkling and necrosis inducing protein 7 [Phytophthora capsici]